MRNSRRVRERLKGQEDTGKAAVQTIQERINWLKTVLDSLDKALQISNTFTALVHALVLAPPVMVWRSSMVLTITPQNFPSDSGHGLVPFLVTFDGISVHLAVPAAEPVVSRAALCQEKELPWHPRASSWARRGWQLQTASFHFYQAVS